MNTVEADRYHSLTQILSFQEPGNFKQAKRINDQYNRQIDLRFWYFIEQVKKPFPEVYDRLILTVEILSEAQLKLLITNPRVSFLLNHFDRTELSRSAHALDQIFTIELARITNICRTKGRLKSYSVDGCSIVTIDKEVKTLDLFRSHTGIAIDFFSNYVLTYNWHSAQKDALPYGEAQVVFNELEETLRLLGGSQYLDFIRLCTEVIGVRSVDFDASKHFFASESQSKYIKQTIIFTNQIENGALLFLEALVHEAVHSFIDMIGIIDDHESEFTAHTNLTKFISPWTGNYVNLTNLDQAIGVWYCLYFFWGWTINALPQFAKEATERLDYIHKGFCKLNVDELLTAGKKELPEAVLETLTEMKYEVEQHGSK